MTDLNILIPMAGNGSRFIEKGYKNPKPLIDVFQKPMIEWVVSNFSSNLDIKFNFICRSEHEEKYEISKTLKRITKNNCNIVFVKDLTEGAACTTLLAESYIDNSQNLIIANSDQFVEWSFENFYHQAKNHDASILTFFSQEKKWSYAKLNENNLVEQVAEKKVISDHATVGIYFWQHGSDYVKYAKQMISKNIRVNNEFYVCPVFNEAIEDEKKISVFDIEKTKMWGLGVPEDLEIFLTNYKGK
jgi:dTDP-glucose pyrophosphorylase